MLASQRKQQILQILTEEKQVMSGELSQRFNVSEDSIRRDLRELAAEGKLQRVHGGALPVSAAIAPIENAQKRADRLQAGGRPRRRRPDPAGTGGDCRWRHHHRGDDRLFTRRPQLHGGHPQPGHRRGAGGPPANRGDPARRQSI
ncbi:Transcriptional regulatory protein [Klebsiella pneumoniae IS43]|uniref:Transcriptional regulatory protein n=1 Tax=Klebsiella pneumoniae IS43 TaxID=1432552 RepID=W1DIF6_KLEPN|nr:Transcriptional regulatory protein [Klebsiella pneumoniae IS43]